MQPLTKYTVICTIAVALVVAAPVSVTTAATPVDDSQTSAVTENVDVWERSLLPLRTTSEGATTVLAPQTYINIESASTGDVPLNRDQYTIHQADDSVELTFESTTGAGTTTVAGDEAQLLAVKLSEEPEATGISDGGARTNLNNIFTNDSAIQSADLLDDAEGVDSINDNGVVETTYTPDSGGVYAFLLVTVDEGEGVSVDDDSVSVDGDVTVVGVEETLVQEGASTVEPSDEAVASGDTVSFDVETALSDDTATHAVMLVSEDELQQQSNTIRVTGDIGENFSEDQVTVDSSFDGVNGVASTDDDARFGSTNPSASQASASAGFVGLFGFVLSEASPDSTGDDALHASATTVSDDADTTVTVDTVDAWPNGTYKYVHVAVGNDTSAIYTDSGTISVNQSAADAGDDSGDSDTSTGGSNDSNDSDNSDSDDSDDSGNSGSSTDDTDNSEDTEAETEPEEDDTETEEPTTVETEDETTTESPTEGETDPVETTESGGGAEQPETADGGETMQDSVETTSADGPGFTAVAGVLALLGAGFLARRD